ncbi:MAG: hypothetical protein HC857_09165 [Synechococcales cyanobacterium RU_4_20]|nr:hypothetical protein [Synechococcales cyanobacterium RU_4_20]
MATSIQQLSTYLNKKGWKYRLEPKTHRIYTGVQGENIDHLLIIIELEEDGEFFSVYAPGVLSDVQNHVHKSAILQTMLSISWETKMLQWEYDPSDGEIRAIIEFPLEDAEMTERQFNRCLHGLVQLVDEMAMPRLRHVMETGFDLDDEDEGERLLLALQAEAPGLLSVLERAMEARKQRGRQYMNDSPSDSDTVQE